MRNLYLHDRDIIVFSGILQRLKNLRKSIDTKKFGKNWIFISVRVGVFHFPGRKPPKRIMKTPQKCTIKKAKLPNTITKKKTIKPSLKVTKKMWNISENRGITRPIDLQSKKYEYCFLHNKPCFHVVRRCGCKKINYDKNKII